MRPSRILLALVALLAGMTGTASAYYHYLHYNTRTAPFVPVPEKFDLSVLNNNTLNYFVSQTGPEKMYTGDTKPALLSQLRLAAEIWNDVPTSALRLAFGGYNAPDATYTTPSLEVVFDEIPPGVLAMGGPTVRAEVTAQDTFVPITRSVLILNKDLSETPSWNEKFFMTVVHEFGHALGLQHSLVSSTMTTQVTRATTKASPLAADDIAGLSLLYPTYDVAYRYGSISGRVTQGAQPVALASVVAIANGAAPVSALTDPDGQYRIDGLPPGNYLVYVHPLPPSVQSDLGPSEIVLPVDAQGTSFPASGSFAAVFYPSTKDWKQATAIAVAAGGGIANINFAVQPRANAGLWGVSAFGYPGQLAIQPAFLSLSRPSRWFSVAWAESFDLMQNHAPLPGLSASVLGEPAWAVGLQRYRYSTTDYLEMDFPIPADAVPGMRHLVFTLNGDIYVLPGAVNLTQILPPSLAQAVPGADDKGAFVTVSGTNLTPDTRVMFDGLEGTRLSQAEDGSIALRPPQGASNQVAVLTAYNPDGQSSEFIKIQGLPTYTYPLAANPVIALNPPTLRAGAEGLIEITGANTNFVDGQSVVGFGSSDVVVRQVSVVNAHLIRVQVTVAAGAALGPVPVTVMTGYEVVTAPVNFAIAAADATQPQVHANLVNISNPGATPYPGSTVWLTVANLVSENPAILAGTQALPIVRITKTAILFQLPATLSPGQLMLTVKDGTAAYPFLAWLDPAPPAILEARVGEQVVGATRPVVPGETVTLIFGVSGLAAPESAHLSLSVGNTILPPVAAAAAVAGKEATYQVQFALPASLTGDASTQIILRLEGYSPAPFALPVAFPAVLQPQDNEEPVDK